MERELRESIVVKGLSHAKDIQQEGHLINLVEVLSLVGKKGIFFCYQRSGGE
jgi:hypothetical protein